MFLPTSAYATAISIMQAELATAQVRAPALLAEPAGRVRGRLWGQGHGNGGLGRRLGLHLAFI
ncbi:hypothetical protein [Hymenobacter sp. PAMC 26628]|uniref:hypothetical protein n=1 Tax=Hymenobacter sp. PAMC 26628 TaxID=1484118 RepID=UPI00077000E3|nr:hypothetical protein [Hymenobacter sp. PAMC 26628]AMJ65934.1 hypothetical protein AXW84_11210 [Hymenobacter sp. PAMC 26628]